MPDLAVIQETAADGSRVLALCGELDLHGALVLEAALASTVGRHRRVVLDCSDVTFIDSTGLGTILGAVRALSRLGGGLAIACDNPTVLRVLTLTGVRGVIPVTPTRGAALNAVHTQLFEPPML